MEHTTPERDLNSGSDDYVVLDPVAYVHALWKHKIALVVTPLLLGAVFLGLSYLSGKTYRSTLTFMPPKSSTAGLFILKPGGASGDEYRAELSSRTVGLDVVRHLGLVQRLKVKDEDTALKIARGMAKFDTDANNFITISVISDNAALSADVANEYFSALNRFTENIAQHESEHRLNFMAGPLRIEEQKLFAAEDELEQAQSRTGLVMPSAQANFGFQQVATLRSRIAELQGQLAMSLAGATEQNPKVVALRSQIANLEGQVRTLESQNQQADSPANLPQRSLEVTRKQREVEFHTSAVEALTKSLGTIQVSESYVPSLSLIDGAFPAKEKYSPSRRTWALVGFAFGFVFTLLRILLGTGYREWKNTEFGRRSRARWKASWKRRLAQGAGA